MSKAYHVIFGNQKRKLTTLVVLALAVTAGVWKLSSATGHTESVLENGIADAAIMEEAWRPAVERLKAALTSGDSGALRSAIANPMRVRLTPGPEVMRGGYATIPWSVAPADEDKLSEYISSFERVERADFDFTGMHVLEGARDPRGLPTGFYLQGDFALLGKDRRARARVDRGHARIELRRKGDAWTIDSLKLSGVESTLRAHGSPSFTDRTAEYFGKQEAYLRREAIRRGGYAVASSDLDGDGFPEIFVGHSERSSLFRNVDGERFVDMTTPALAAVQKAKAAAFVDFTNSGRKDLVLTSFDPYDKGNNVRLFENDGRGAFAERKGFIRFESPANYPMPLAVGHFNGDELPDFYVGFPGSQDFTFLAADVEFDRELISHGIYRNDGALAFTDVSKKMGDLNYDRRDLVFPHSAIAFDLFGAGTSDLLVLDDRDNLSPFYASAGKNGAMGFRLSSDKIGITGKRYAMGAAVGDLNNDGHLDIVLSYVNFSAASRFEHFMSTTWSELVDTGFAGRGLEVYLNDGSNRFTPVASRAISHSIGEGIGNVELVDFDGDGWLDIYVANGLWSGAPQGGKDVTPEFVADLLRGGEMGSAWNLKDRKISKTQSEFMDKLVSDPKLSIAGFQRNALLRNNGDMTFTDVAPLEGVDSIHDGYVVSVLDVNADGKQDLLLRNGDPGVETPGYASFQLFVNERPSANVVRLALKGVKDSRDAIGAEARVLASGVRQYRQVIANNGAAQSELALTFGLGTSAAADELEVKWRSGETQRFKSVAAGTYTLEQGGALVCVSCRTLKIGKRTR